MQETTITTTLTICQPDELSPLDQQLIRAAKEATSRSYSKYSAFSVGAAVLLANGETIVGCNQENAAFSTTICAERTALFSAGAQHPHSAVVAIAIAAKTGGQFTPEPVTPCGTCRQALLETEQRFGRAVRIIMYGANRTFVVDGTRSLMPLSFSEESM
jgi:cytidine deaminase